MSSGIVICPKCDREVHQDGPEITIEAHGFFQKQTTWTHCEDKTPMCADASPIYPGMRAIVGKHCDRDAIGEGW